MSDITLTKKNEVYIKVECERSTAQELSDYFTFLVPGYQFTPQYKNRLWDGKIRLFNLQSFTIYHGLLAYIKKFCEERGYKLDVHPDLELTENFSVYEANEFIKTLGLPFEPRDYQLDSFVQAIRTKRTLLISPTASGKSLIQYLVIRYLFNSGHKKGLMIVPRTSLVEQMFSDFKSYGWDVDENVHRQYSGREKDTDLPLTITTWQSIYKREPEYFEQFDFVLGDEAHEFKAKSLMTILTSCLNARFRFGCTGTLDGTQTHKLVLEGLFGPAYRATTTKELMDKKQIADFKIKCLILKYPDDVCKESRGWDYHTEMEYIVLSKARNEFIRNLALSLKGNTMILFQFVEKHGKVLHAMLMEKVTDRKVFLIYGKTDIELREQIRAITETEKDAIIVASYGTSSTGINIRNLHNIIFSSPSKSRVRNLQSIGRSLRLGDDKDEAVLFDISDDFRTGKHVNFTLNHFMERVKIYDDEKFNYKFYNIDIKP